MIEFISFETIKALTLLFFVSLVTLASFELGESGSKKKKISFSKVSLGLLFSGLLILFIEADSSQAHAKENLQSFRNGSSLLCQDKDFSEYRVDKSSGWGEDGYYFTKDSLLIRTDMCGIRN